jgi:16S rRNA (cytosine1402-N4)-methyltransferase
MLAGAQADTHNEREEHSSLPRQPYHVPVMLVECCDALVIDPSGVYVDGTLGGGGHTEEILRRLDAHGHLHSFDADEQAIAESKKRFAHELSQRRADGTSASRLTLHHENFFMACSIKNNGKPLDEEFLSGILLDLGVSSRQLDTDGIGLSYRVNSRLDMRFGSHLAIPTAASLIASSTLSDLEWILRTYGEEPFAKPIARRIVEIRRASPLQTTFDLRAVVEACVPPHLRVKSLSRVFQAFRIAVNDELNVLEQTLRGVVPLLRPGGRIVVLSYHSLEDRVVKTVFHELSRTSIPDPTNPKSSTKPVQPVLREITKRPLIPSDAEIESNYRARSAKLRIAERVAGSAT